MSGEWGVVGCAYMAQEYCRVLIAKNINPQIFTRDLSSQNVENFRKRFPSLEIHEIAEIGSEPRNWLVCTSIDSHEEVCSKLTGRIYCEKPYAHHTDYDAEQEITILLNRRYYYWVEHIRQVIGSGRIVKVIASIPEKSVDALITQSIHVIDLLWYLTGPFGAATRIGDSSPSFVLSTQNGIPLVINMNYGSHENFSLRFYADDGVVFEARPLEAMSIAEGMAVREPDDELPVRSYQPIVKPLEYRPTGHKPGLEELIDDIASGEKSRLPTLAEHQQIHAWMRDNMS